MEKEFLIADPKGVIDSLYLSSRKKNNSHFPELHFPKEFSFKKALRWVEHIPRKDSSVCLGEA